MTESLTESHRVVIQTLATGVPGLDEVLGGGIPEASFNLLAGAPGTGKTTLAQQIMFANATPERPGIFFTVLGEPPLKMLRYQQQFRFFDAARVGADVRYVNLSDEVLTQDLDALQARITTVVEQTNPGIVVVDSFRTVARTVEGREHSELALQHFVQRLALRLTSWETTTFLIGEFGDGESRDAVFTVADGVIWLLNEVERNTSVRKLHVTKVRGQGPQPGLHTMRLSARGVEVFPRMLTVPPLATTPGVTAPPADVRHSVGIPALDAMLGGGIPAGDAVLVTGPTGAGKTILATQFVAAGVVRGERAVIAVFEEHPDAYIRRAQRLGLDLAAMVAAGTLDILYLRPVDLSVDETLQAIRTRVERLGATRVVIDSLTGFEAALAPTVHQDFRESFYRMMVTLTALRITVLSTVEVSEASDYLRFSPYNISFLTDNIVSLRYVELEGELRSVLAVIKMRNSEHSRALRAYAVTGHGLELGETLSEYRGIITGVPERLGGVREVDRAELTMLEALVLRVVRQVGEAAADGVVTETGLTLAQVQQAFDHLQAVGDVRAVERDGQTRYRAAPRSRQ